MGILLDRAAQIARDAVAPTLCAAGGLQRAGLDLAEKLNKGRIPTGLPRAVQRGLQSFCDPPVGDIPLPSSPYSGGQCQGVAYFLRVYWRNPGDTADSLNSDGPYIGPTGGLNFRYEWDAQFETWRFVWDRPNGLPNSITLGGTLAGGAFAPNTKKVVRTEMERGDGQPDTCGDPPPVFPPGSPPPTNPIRPPVNINIDLPDVGPVNVTFAPKVGPITIGIDAEVYAPVDIKVTGPSIDIDFSFDISLTDPTKPPIPRPDRPTGPDGRPRPPDCPKPAPCLPEPDEGEPDGPEPEDEDEPDLEVSGVVVESTVTAGARGLTEVGQGFLPRLYLPRVGLLRFRYRRQDGGVSFGQDINIKELEVVVPAPKAGLKCIGAAIYPYLGVECSLSLIFVPVSKRC